MLLIDSLYINYGGGLQLLRYLVDNLLQRGVDFFLLQDNRVQGFDGIAKKEVMPATMKARKAWYKQHGNEYTTVLCFGNVPPPVRLKAKVYTYFHNINMLKIPTMFTWKVRLKNYMKQRVMDYYGKNTDAWIVQTDNTAWELRSHLRSGNKPRLVLPFYKISPELQAVKTTPILERTDYALIGELSYARGHGIILEVWKRLHERGFDRTLHLTVSQDNERQRTFCQRVMSLQREGVQIVNHGFVPFNEVIEIYKQSKAIIYPSLNESLGLSIIEGVEAGCDILASNLPFTHAICKPTKTFDPTSINNICDVIMEYDKRGGSRSELTVRSKTDELCDMLTSTEVGGVNVKRELWFKPGLGSAFSRSEKVKLLLWRFVDFWLFKPSLTIFSPWRVFLLRLFGAKIGRGCYISPKALILAPWNFQMGNHSSIDDYAYMRSTGRITIGDYVSVGMYVHIVPGGHDIRSRGFENNATFVKIEDGVFLGADSFVGRGVTIGSFSVLGSRAAAFKDVPENSVAVGMPAKVIGERIPHDVYINYRYSL